MGRMLKEKSMIPSYKQSCHKCREKYLQFRGPSFCNWSSGYSGYRQLPCSSGFLTVGVTKPSFPRSLSPQSHCFLLTVVVFPVCLILNVQVLRGTQIISWAHSTPWFYCVAAPDFTRSSGSIPPNHSKTVSFLFSGILFFYFFLF